MTLIMLFHDLFSFGLSPVYCYLLYTCYLLYILLYSYLMLPPSSSSWQPVGRRLSEDIKLFVNRTAMRPNGPAPFLHAFPHAQALTQPIYGPDKQIWYTLKSPKKCRIMKFVVLKHSATSCLCIFMQVHEHSSVRTGSVLPYWSSEVGRPTGWSLSLLVVSL